MKNSLSKISLLLLLICLSTSAWSQKSISNVTDTLPKKKFDWNKVYTGGNIGLLFGTVTIIDIYPIIGYRLTKKTSVGVGITYQYFSDNRYNFSTNIYGGSVFVRHVITENFFAHSEYELLSREFILIDNTGMIVSKSRKNVGSLLVGGGYRQRIGGNSYFVLMILWNLNESVYSLYPNPIIRMGVNIGL